MKPFAESCEQNKQVILDVIKPVLMDTDAVFEVGSGTGQHAVFFAAAMPHLFWYPSERQEYLAGIQEWLDEYYANPRTPDNIVPPVILDVMQEPWPAITADAVFTANTLHIMHWNEVQRLFAKLPDILTEQGHFLAYGPFNYNGQYTSNSNRQFDLWLKNRDPLSGIRDINELTALAEANGLFLQNDHSMPANNRILHWQKQ